MYRIAVLALLLAAASAFQVSMPFLAPPKVGLKQTRVRKAIPSSEGMKVSLNESCRKDVSRVVSRTLRTYRYLSGRGFFQHSAFCHLERRGDREHPPGCIRLRRRRMLDRRCLGAYPRAQRTGKRDAKPARKGYEHDCPLAAHQRQGRAQDR